MALLMLGRVPARRTIARRRPSAGSPSALCLAAWLVLNQPAGKHVLFDGSFVVDGFARFMKVLTFVASAGALFLSFDYMRETRSQKFEYPVLVLLATAGMGMMISASDLIALYLGLELQSLALYVVAAIRRDDVRSSEAGSSISCWARCRRACCSTAPRLSTASPARPASRPLPPPPRRAAPGRTSA
jgi:NADH-quinone oxidoreductase subunit N